MSFQFVPTMFARKSFFSASQSILCVTVCHSPTWAEVSTPFFRQEENKLLQNVTFGQMIKVIAVQWCSSYLAPNMHGKGS